MQPDLLRNPRLDRAIELFLPVLAVMLALLIGAVMIVLMDADPIEAYQGLWEGAFGTKNAVADTMVKATPL